MEGTNNSQMINEMINELNAPDPIPEQPKNSHLVVGEEYKITGGKYKKHKICRLNKINDTYSDVSVEVKTADITTTEICKVKNCYLLRKDPPAIDMPEAEDLMVVENLEEYLAENPGQWVAPEPGQGKKAIVEPVVKEISWEQKIADNPSLREYLKSNEINKLVEENERLKAVIQNLAIKLS